MQWFQTEMSLVVCLSSILPQSLLLVIRLARSFPLEGLDK
jgi:hypothetical protein